MVRRIPLAPSLARFGFKPTRAAPLTPEQLLARAVERAWLCGAGYSNRRWIRRAPPRMRIRSYRDPDCDLLRAQAQAFFRGYDAATAARYAHGRPWSAPWAVPAHEVTTHG